MYDPQSEHCCDIRGRLCRMRGTTWRCGYGCDFDVCHVCSQSGETLFLSADSINWCFELASLARSQERAANSWICKRDLALPQRTPWKQVTLLFSAAKFLGFEVVAKEARCWLQSHLSGKCVRAVTAAALAWKDAGLLRSCYWQLVATLSRLPPAPGPTCYGINPRHFSYESRRWSLNHFEAASQFASEKRKQARAAPLDGFMVCQLKRAGHELCLLRDTAVSCHREELLRVEFVDTIAIFYTKAEDGSVLGPAAGTCRRWSECCCGVLEPARLGQCFSLYDGEELLPQRNSKRVKEIRQRFPYTPRTLLCTVTWDMPLLGPGQGLWHLSLDMPNLPLLRGCARSGATGGIELVPPGGEEDTPWVVLGAAESGGERAVMWRVPVETVVAFALAVSAAYPWNAKDGPDNWDE